MAYPYGNEKLVGYNKQLYDTNFIIKPPPDPSEDTSLFQQTQYTRIAIDSFTRDITLYPEPNNYVIEFDEKVEDVTSLELINMKLPLSNFMVNKYFNTVTFIVDNTTYTATVPSGDYDTTSLPIAVTAAMNAVSSVPFTVTYVVITDNYLFSASSPFSLDFTGSTSLAALLGFGSSVYTSSNNSLQSPNRQNPCYNDYALMYLEYCDIIKSSYSAFDNAFAVIGDIYGNMNISEAARIMKAFNPPLRLTKLRIRFFDKYYNPYEFNGLDHRMEIILRSSKVKYQV